MKQQNPKLAKWKDELAQELKDLDSQYEIGLEIKKLFISEALISSDSNQSLSHTLDRFMSQVQKHTKRNESKAHNKHGK